MQEDFHYYATYCAAYLAGYEHEDCMSICYSAQLVDCCSKTFLSKIKAPKMAATTQTQLELADAGTDIIALQDITRIWASFHFLPKDLYAIKDKRTKRYLQKYRMIAGPNSDLLVKTVKLPKGRTLQHIGIAMHVLADTWAHMYFAGTPSLVINNTNDYFFEVNSDDTTRKITFKNNPGLVDDFEKGIYVNSLQQNNENSIMNLGHGRAGHLPDYSFIKYKYMPAWNDYETVIKDNPSDYTHAFCQMIYAMKYYRGLYSEFQANVYDEEAITDWKDKIDSILRKRQLSASADWKALAKDLSGQTIEDFDMEKYQKEYIEASSEIKPDTFLGKFIDGALQQKGMVTNEIYKSGSILAGFSKLIMSGGANP